ncbi:MAG: 4'-phosphopantetheinyl transferase superfamily protein [Lachnospiraceae bacterium]|nr:4'-phosphopantetheinyl transferase superfamily protein [Lachnospiraceae bacterium]
MIHIYWAELEDLKHSYDEKVNMLHASRADKLSNFKMPADRIRSLGAGLLLEKGLEDYLGRCLPVDERGRPIIRYNYAPQGKPYLEEYPNVHFSLSHSGDLAVLALSDTEVGIDVQENRGYNEKVAKRFYHKDEQKMIDCYATAEEREILFYQLWTGKEAYIKYTGEGMSRELRDFFVDLEKGQIVSEGQMVASYHFIDLNVENYYCSLVFDKELQKIDKIIKIAL